MASLLAWICWDGAEPDPRLWAALRQRARARASGAGEELHRPGVWAWACAARAAAPAAVTEADGLCVLRDSALALAIESSTQTPADSAAAVVVIDLQTRSVRLLRDRLGQRPLVYARIAGGLLVASGEAVLLAHPGVSRSFDADYLAAYFGATAAAPERTAFSGIFQLPSATRLDLHANGEQRQTLRREPLEAAWGWSDVQLVRAFRERLHAAVSADCADATRLGLSLSGGLDSTAVAVHAAAGRARGHPLLALSYGCNTLPGLDERALAGALATQLGLAQQSIAADAYAPLSQAQTRPVSGDTPICSPYRELKTVVYQACAAADVDVLLTGNFGDHLCAPPEYWLSDALARHRYGLALSSYAKLWFSQGGRACWHDRGWRGAMRPAARAASGAPEWLTPTARERVLAQRQSALAEHRHWRRPAQAAHLLGSYAAFDAAGETGFSEPFGVEVRHPLRNWALTQLALSAPADLSWRGGVSKWWLREALRGRLPEPLRTRPKSANMQPLFRAGLQAAMPRVRELVASGREHWSVCVQTEYVERTLRAPMPSATGDLLIWLLAGFGLWLEALRPDISQAFET